MKKILRVLLVAVFSIFLVSGAAMATPITIDFGTGMAGTGGTVITNIDNTVVSGANIRIGALNVSDAPSNDGTYYVTGSGDYPGYGLLSFDTESNFIRIDGEVAGLNLGYQALLTGTISSWTITSSASGLDFEAWGPDDKALALLTALGIPSDQKFAYYGFSLTTANLVTDTNGTTGTATSTDIRNTSVPEPTTMLLLGLGLLGIGIVSRKKK